MMMRWRRLWLCDLLGDIYPQLNSRERTYKQALRTRYVRMRTAIGEYFDDNWNLLDVLNLSIFVYTITARIQILSDSIGIFDRVSALKEQTDPWDDTNHVNFIPMYEIAQSFQFITFLKSVRWSSPALPWPALSVPIRVPVPVSVPSPAVPSCFLQSCLHIPHACLPAHFVPVVLCACLFVCSLAVLPPQSP